MTDENCDQFEVEQFMASLAKSREEHQLVTAQRPGADEVAESLKKFGSILYEWVESSRRIACLESGEDPDQTYEWMPLPQSVASRDAATLSAPVEAFCSAEERGSHHWLDTNPTRNPGDWGIDRHTLHTRHVSGRPFCAVTGLLAAVVWSTASCGGHVETADPPSHPIDEMSQHGGGFCPTTLPMAPRETYGFGTEQPATAEPNLWKPQQAWLCRYVSEDVAPRDSNGAWFKWVRLGTPRRLDAQQMGAFSTTITQLRVPTRDRPCADDLGPRYLVSYAYEHDLTGVVIDDYGCNDVRLTDNPFATVPGDPSQPGTVKGVLTGPTRLLHELNVRQ